MKALGKRFKRSATNALLHSLYSTCAPELVDTSEFPIVIRSACGARVSDVDGNRYIDLTSFFGVAFVGHRNRAVVKAVKNQAGRLLHAMGDVHPAAVTARFLKTLSTWLPADDYRAVLSLNGSDAIDCALKFAAAATGRSNVIAFEGAYHGLSSGALEVTSSATFRNPFAAALKDRCFFAPWPSSDGSDLETVLSKVRSLVKTHEAAAIVVEPIQGRGGIRVPPPGFLVALQGIASKTGAILVIDEIYTGVGRTGSFLASNGVVPDILCLGKALGGGMPLSVCLMRGKIPFAVRRAAFEAPHTYTFLGHPLACAAGLAVLNEVSRKDLLTAARRLGERIVSRAHEWRRRSALVHDVRGKGAMIGVELMHHDGTPATAEANVVVDRCLEKGVILLTEGVASNVLAFTPPAVITDHELEFALSVVEQALMEVAS